MWNESERRYVYASEMTRSRDGYETAPRPNTPECVAYRLSKMAVHNANGLITQLQPPSASVDK